MERFYPFFGAHQSLEEHHANNGQRCNVGDLFRRAEALLIGKESIAKEVFGQSCADFYPNQIGGETNGQSNFFDVAAIGNAY